MSTTSVFILTLNELEGIRNFLPKINREWADEFFLLDGNSTDGTIEEAKKIGFEVVIQKNKGMGNGIREGFEHAKSDYVLYCSPDGNDLPEDIPRLIEAIKTTNADMVHISRFGKNGKSFDAGLRDRFGNKLFAFLVNVGFGGKLTDVLNGFRITKKKVMKDLQTEEGVMVTEEEMCINCLKKEYKIIELDGVEHKRIGGEEKKPGAFVVGSQLSWLIIKEFIFW